MSFMVAKVNAVTRIWFSAGRDGVLLGPLGRLGRAAEVAALIAFLASGEAGLITGQSFVIDGGETTGSASWSVPGGVPPVRS